MILHVQSAHFALRISLFMIDASAIGFREKNEFMGRKSFFFRQFSENIYPNEGNKDEFS